MAYRLQRDESVFMGVRRVAHEVVGHAIGLLDDPGDDLEDAVHEIRKDCKMLRGLVRLVRPTMGEAYVEANAAFRDAARHLSSIRDAHALLATFDDLIAATATDDRSTSDAFVAVRRGLVERAAEASAAVADGDERLMEARRLLVEARDAIDRWPLSNDIDVVARGLAKTYRRGRRRARESIETPTDELLHQWRKRTKYTWYHVRLLRDAAPGVLTPLAEKLHDLSDVLGDDHDLAVLTAQLRAEPDAFGGDDAVSAVITVIELVRQELQQRASRLGWRLYVERPTAFAERLVGYWSAWQLLGDEWAAGELAALAAPSDDLDERSVRQLYAIARELDVAGRSRLDRDGLIAAVRAAGWSGD